MFERPNTPGLRETSNSPNGAEGFAMLRILLVASLAMPGAALATDGKSMAKSCGVGFGVDSAAGLDKAFCLGVVHAVQWLAPGVARAMSRLAKLC